MRLTILRSTAALVLAVAFLLFDFAFDIPVFAQNTATTATIEGVITDPSDAPVASATAQLQATPSVAGNRPAQATSSADGRFRFDVPPGRYRLTVTQESLRRYEQDLNLSLGQNPDLRIQLALEPLSSSVVVSASAQPIEANAASVPVSIITRDEIEARQIPQIAPLLQSLPGITFSQTGPIGGVTSIFLDGGTSSYTKVLVDGIPINDPGGAVDTLSQFTLDDVDKIEVTHGAESSLDGSDAMTGVVAIFTHRGSTHMPLLVAESDGGSFSTGRGMAQLSGLAGPLDYSVTGGYYATNGEFPNNFFLNRTLSGNFGVTLPREQALRLTVRANTGDAGEAGQTLFTPPSLDEHNDVHDITAGLTWDFSTGPHWQHRLFGFENDIHELFANPFSSYFLSPDPFSECEFPRLPQAVPSALYCDFTFVEHNQINRAGFQGQSSYVARHFSATLGYYYEVENAYLADLDGLHARRNNQAGFLELRWQTTNRLVLNAGFREEDNANFGTRGVPRVGGAYTLRYGRDAWGPTRLRANYSQGIKEPSLDQSFGTDPCFPGNPDLLPEESRTTSAGIEQRLDGDKATLSGDFFYNQFRNVISFTDCFPGAACPVAIPSGCLPIGFGTFFNTDLARAVGARFVAEWKLAKHLGLQANYTYDDSRVLISPNATDPAELPGNHLLRRPVNSGSVALNGGVRRFHGNIAATLVGRRTDSDFLGLGFTSNPGYMRMDVAASYALSTHASVIGHVTNLFNKDYQDVLGYPALGRAAYIGMRFRLGGE
jgi:vitamin B12 transporter